jgi:zinc/manganese transport system substrate-binding protein
MKFIKICITLLIILSIFTIPGMAANTASSGDLTNKGMPSVTTIPVTTSSIATPLTTQVTAIATPISTTTGKVLNITSTTTVLLDPLRAIGGDRVKVISVTDPTICPHLQSDIIPGRIQINKDIIAASDLYVSFNNSSMDKGAVQAVTKFIATNYNRQITWTTPRSSYLAWNTPTDARKMVGEVKTWLIAADPADTAYFESNYNTYLAQIDGSDISSDQKAINQKTDVIVMEWQRDASEKWLGLHIVDVFNSQSSDSTVHTPKDLADLINANPEKYRNVSFVIENMQSGEIAKGVEEALQAKGINAKRIVFTNFPESVSGVSSIPDVLAYNRDLVKTEQAARIEGNDVEPVSLNQASGSSNGSPTVQVPTMNLTANGTALQTTGTTLPLTNLSNSSPLMTTSTTTNNTTVVTTAPSMTLITTATVPVSTANGSAVPTTAQSPGFSWAIALLGVGLLLIGRLR